MFSYLLMAAAVAPAPFVPKAEDMKAAFSYSTERRGHSMIVVADGKTIFEDYKAPNNARSVNPLASGTKTFNGVVALAAQADGLIDLDDPVGKYLPQWREGNKATATIRQLLSLESGLGSTGGGLRGPSWASVLDDPLTAEPGTKYQYGQAPFNTFGAVIEAVLKTESYEAYLTSRIFKPLGISAQWTRCDDGRPQMGGGGQMTARDWATYGQFILQRGQWEGKSIIPADLWDELVKPAASNPRYGLSCWLGLPATGGGTPVNAAPFAAPWVPKDMFMAAGAGNQRLYIVPSQKLVIVHQATLLSDPRWSDVGFIARVYGQPDPNPDSRTGRGSRPGLGGGRLGGGRG